MTKSASLATRATNWKQMMTTNCARSHLFAHSLQVSPGSVNVHREAAGAAPATAILIAAERVVTVCEH